MTLYFQNYSFFFLYLFFTPVNRFRTAASRSAMINKLGPILFLWETSVLLFLILYKNIKKTFASSLCQLVCVFIFHFIVVGDYKKTCYFLLQQEIKQMCFCRKHKSPTKTPYLRLKARQDGIMSISNH